MMTEILANIIDVLKKLVAQLARRSARFCLFIFSLFRRAAGCSKFRYRRLTAWTHLSSGAISRSQRDIAGENVPICHSFLPAGHIELEVAEEPPSPQDDPYSRIHSRYSQPLRGGTAVPLLETNCITANRYPGAHSRLISAPRHGSPDMPSIPFHSPVQAVPRSDPGIDHHTHYTVPPGNDEQPGQEVVMVHDGLLIAPMVATEVRRYQRSVPRVLNVSKTTIPAMTVTFPVHDMAMPQGWITLVHPEGSRYFVHQEKVRPDHDLWKADDLSGRYIPQRTFTETNICNKQTCEDIEYYMQFLLDELQRVVEHGNLELDMKQVDLVLEPKTFDGDSVVCCYYFANHRDRCLFWLNDFNAKGILSDCEGVENLSHIRFAIEAQYWRHCDYFPSLFLVTQSLVDEVKDMLMHAACDHLTSMQSSAAFDAIELRDHLSVVDKIKVYSPADQSMQQCHAAIVIGRIMYTFSHNHFVNYHGEDCARLVVEQTVHGWAYKRSPLMVILAPLLFFDPVTQVRDLHKVFVDKMACTARWNAFSSKLNGQLQDSNLLATVLLNANVGFLAIDSVDGSGKSSTQVASYMSLVASMGSMILGLLLVSHNRTMGQGTHLHAELFLSGLHDREHGLEKLAIIYSLPKALLIWGMVFFFAAFSVDWWSPGDTTSRVIVGAVILVVFVMISYTVILIMKGDWQTNPLHGDIGLGLLSRLADTRKQVVEFMAATCAQRDVAALPIHRLRLVFNQTFQTQKITPTPLSQFGDVPPLLWIHLCNHYIHKRHERHTEVVVTDMDSSIRLVDLVQKKGRV
ncbi:uncharacterized protein EDB91DRAFT_1333047 [Suillus paluster]|uniref:uncharacterized protein n=1 Tax=Suillus paluster TaxID=48578 RepID=UPI001B86E24F|nr:uncharacterized protein EDB91DRAFT_1333047 [Suillus paluster]KAG1753613.1 hypothetical protein EDB91DRAFT_1333047 [Suillus paluster]